MSAPSDPLAHPSILPGSPKGYKLSIFKHGKVEEKYCCVHCRYVLRNPVQSICGHHFCKDCVEFIFRTVTDPKCAMCLNERSHNAEGGNEEEEDIHLVESKIFPDNAIKREFTKLKVFCSNEGCGWTGPFKNFEKHVESECPDVIIDCPYKCGATDIRRLNLDDHLQSYPSCCKYHAMGCRKQGTAEELAEHERNASSKHFDLVLLRLTKLQLENTRLRNSIERLTEDLDPIRTRYAEQIRENETLQKKIGALTKDLKDHQQSIWKRQSQSDHNPAEQIDNTATGENKDRELTGTAAAVTGREQIPLASAIATTAINASQLLSPSMSNYNNHMTSLLMYPEGVAMFTVDGPPGKVKRGQGDERIWEGEDEEEGGEAEMEGYKDEGEGEDDNEDENVSEEPGLQEDNEEQYDDEDNHFVSVGESNSIDLQVEFAERYVEAQAHIQHQAHYQGQVQGHDQEQANGQVPDICCRFLAHKCDEGVSVQDAHPYIPRLVYDEINYCYQVVKILPEKN